MTHEPSTSFVNRQRPIVALDQIRKLNYWRTKSETGDKLMTKSETGDKLRTKFAILQKKKVTRAIYPISVWKHADNREIMFEMLKL